MCVMFPQMRSKAATFSQVSKLLSWRPGHSGSGVVLGYCWQVRQTQSFGFYALVGVLA